MRDRLGASESVSSAYILALVGRAVAIELYTLHKVPYTNVLNKINKTFN